MNINTILKKEGIYVVSMVDKETKEKLLYNITNNICTRLPEFKINKEFLYNKLYELNLYYAKLKEDMSDAIYFHKNKSIYINYNSNCEKLEDCVLHEVIHFLQEKKSKHGSLQKMGLSRFTPFNVYGLAINEAATQHLSAFIQNKKFEDVRYFGINFRTNSPTYYPIECAVLSQLDYLLENNTLFRSTLFSTDDFQNEMYSYFSKDTTETIFIALDEMLTIENKISKLNSKILNITDRNYQVDSIIAKINNLKLNILVKFMRTQNLILSSYFDNLFTRIFNFEQAEYFRKKLTNFKNYIGISEGYTFFEDYYIKTIDRLNDRIAQLEKDSTIQSLIPVTESKLTILLNKLKSLFRLNGYVANKVEDTNKMNK